jgi:hypothetical protein
VSLRRCEKLAAAKMSRAASLLVGVAVDLFRFRAVSVAIDARRDEGFSNRRDLPDLPRANFNARI